MQILLEFTVTWPASRLGVMQRHVCVLPILFLCLAAQRPATAPTTQPHRLPHIELDLKAKQVRLECEAVNAAAPLELFVCAAGGAEHETVLRTRAKASHLHLALLMLGLEPGKPSAYVPPPQKREAPTGPRVKISCRFQRDGRTIQVPAHQLMRQVKDQKPLGPMTWLFTGSRLMDDGRYAADVTGHIVTVVNFEFSVLDVPELRSSANESLEWEVNPDLVPKRNSPVWVIIEPADEP